MKKPDKFKLAYKLTLSYLIYHILLILAILFLADRGIVSIENRFKDKYRETAEASMETLNQRLLQLKDMMTLVMYDEDIQVLRGRRGYLSTYEEVDLKLKIKNELSVLTNQYSYIKEMGVYFPEYEMWIDTSTWFENQTIPGRKIYGDLLEKKGDDVYLRLGIQNDKKYTEGYVCLVREELKSILDQKMDDTIKMKVAIDGDELSQVKNESDYYQIYVKSSIYPVEVTYYIPPKILSFRKYLYVFGGISIMFLVVIAAAFSSYLNKAIHRPLNNIVRFMEKAKEENNTGTVIHQGEEEFQYVTTEFNKMKEYLQYYTQHQYEQEIIMRQMELDHLQEQIKPHFLYNCFANISNLCKAYDVEKVEKLSATLSKYYSYITRTNKDYVMLCQEYEHMKNYLTIQKIRFEDRVCIEMETLPKEGENIKVPRLILQPIVENAYKYVFEHVEKKGKLRIGARAIDSTIIIVVEDSGFEMNTAVIERIQKALTIDDEYITGLGNLNKRLQFTNPQNTIHVEESELGGTKMRLTIVGKGEEEHV